MLTRQVAADITVLRQRGLGGLAVNVYVLLGRDETVLVDAGFPGRAGELMEAIEKVGRPASSIRRIFYTHTHIDHMGAGPDWASLVQAEHVVWHEAIPFAEAWDTKNEANARWQAWLLDVVEDGAIQERIANQAPSPGRLFRRPISPIRAAQEGELVPAGPYTLEPVFLPGHDPHHIALFDRARKVAFTGDAVLALPTPLCRLMGDDTGAYLQSLTRLLELDVEVGYPGHGIPLTRFRSHVERSRRFVEDRNDAILRTLASGPMSIHQLAAVEMGEPAGNIQRFSLILANTESSVHYLTHAGRLIRRGNRVQLA